MEELSPVKKALLEVRNLRAKLELLEKRPKEAIAVIGLGLRLPGDVNSPEAFWDLLRNGIDAVSEVPDERWENERYYDPDYRMPGKLTTRYGAFLKEVDQFDAAFFGISPREAESMDPQHRLLLEVTWEALERAGQSPAGLMGSQTGVFLGISNSDYQRLLLSDLSTIDPYVSTGNLFSVAAGRLSYTLGLHGPNVAIDTACSSSLTAVHLAVQSLRQGECDLALAGGVNLMFSPAITINFSKAQMMAPDGHCKTFDAAADGYVRGEGCVMIALKRLSDAAASGDPVLAVIRGSAINHDGRSGGLTAPNGPAQTEVIRRALANSGVQPQQISYVETHGTGTSLGDPIEVRALLEALATDRGADNPLMLGSVKTNLGHLEAAAGLAGLVKAILALQQRQIPPHLHLRMLNPHIALGGLPVAIPTQLTEWAGQEPRLAGVSAFGLSGTNAHVIVEEAPVQGTGEQSDGDRALQVLCLSAMTPQALQELAAKYTDFLKSESMPAWADVCFTASVGRSHFQQRLAVVAAGTREAQTKLAELAAGRRPHGVIAGQVKSGPEPAVTFLYSGHGANYVGMGRQLYLGHAVFRAAMDECDALAQPQVGQRLLGVLYPDLFSGPQNAAELLEQMTYAQMALFALQYALTQLWRSWGVVPALVMGHSAGEYAAAVAAGIFSLADGLKLVMTRGQLLQASAQSDANGMMAAVFADAERVEPYLVPYADQVSLAAFNGPHNVVISGAEAAMREVLANLRAANIKTRQLSINQAAHSPLLDPLLPEFERRVAELARNAPRIGLISSVTGQWASAEQVTDAGYWRDHLRQPVRFQQAMATLRDLGQRVFIEIGPKPMLLALGERCLPAGTGVWVPSLRDCDQDWQQVMESLAKLYANGVAIDWQAVQGGAKRRRAAMPTYPFQRKRFWTSVQPDAGVPVQRPAPQAVWASVCTAGKLQADQVPLDLAVHAYEAKWQALHRLSSAYIVAALRHLGGYCRVGEAYTPAEFAARFGVAPGSVGLVQRWLTRLAAEGMLEQEGESFTAAQPLAAPDFAPLRAAAKAALVDGPMIFDYVERCGQRLAGVLTGAVIALDTLFPGGSPALAEAMYQEWVVSRYYANLMRGVLQGYVSAHSGRPPLRILEVGAGTGATTAALLPILPLEHTVYQFTDVTEMFLSRAAAKFAAYPFVRYGRLDLEQDPLGQGYTANAYDVIVATNVLHATADLHVTLDYVHSLLAPGGLLLINEVTEHLAWFDITTGLIEGWHRFKDDLRLEQPLLSPQTWDGALRGHGFVEVAAWPQPGSATAVLGQHVIAALKSGNGAKRTADSELTRETGSAGTLWVDNATGASAQPEDTAEFVQRVQAAVPDERHELLFNFTCERIRRVLRLDVDAALEENQRLLDLGLDSLIALELRQLLGSGLGLAEDGLSATMVFDYPTVGALAEYLGRQLWEAQSAEPATSDAAASGEKNKIDKGRENGHAQRLADLAGMSDAEVEALLMAKLNQR